MADDRRVLHPSAMFSSGFYQEVKRLKDLGLAADVEWPKWARGGIFITCRLDQRYHVVRLIVRRGLRLEQVLSNIVSPCSFFSEGCMNILSEIP